MTTASASRWRGHSASILAWAIVLVGFVVGYVSMVRTRPLYAPDSAHYLAKAFWFLGASPQEAHDRVAAFAAGYGITEIPGVERMFEWGLVQPRVVLSAIATPFVAAFGPIGLAVTTAFISLALIIVLTVLLMRRVGNVPAVAVMLMVTTSAYLVFYNGAMLTESLSALLTALTLMAAWRYIRQPRAWLLVVMGALTVTSAFTRQATLIVAGAFLGAWLFGMLVSRSWRSPWMWPAVVVTGASLGSQVLQAILFPSFSQADQFIKQTGAETLGGAILAIPRMALKILATDVYNYLANDPVLLVFILVSLAGIVLFWRRSEAHLLVGAILAISLYNITNGTPTAFRYAIPGLVFYVAMVGIVIRSVAKPQRGSQEVDLSEQRGAYVAG
ncbi:hypothetical protein ACFPER_11745 [Agromyces aurantiacus]|uniref:Glycosyltransferase RgtA/B/C/D-like domain-containing protein n=1 Tax=Agromyces aurantiacus TaxID=165814 RepID=A0ABV9R823_9MICO|nr:hypothetical protein [Agromyces aurantiacus]MBM7504153.1 hypothetical protein [Agromyces aurantiacus]